MCCFGVGVGNGVSKVLKFHVKVFYLNYPACGQILLKVMLMRGTGSYILAEKRNCACIKNNFSIILKSIYA